MNREISRQYGLECTNNSKTGFAFSMPRSMTCIAKTDTCETACYGNGVRYQTRGQKEKRQRNYKTVEFLLKTGGPELLSQNLIFLVDHARPVDWIASQVTGEKTFVPWTFRIHDIGDYPEFRTIPCQKIIEQKVVMVSQTDHHSDYNTRHSI